MKKIYLLLLTVSLLLCACSKTTPAADAGKKEESSKAETSEETPTEESSEISEEAPATESGNRQETGPSAGEVTATITVKGFGDIKVKFYAEDAPKAVENFLTHAKEGYYDGVIFHRVMNDFMIQGGDPTGTGYYGESIWGKDFEDEFTDLVPIRGALCMANGGPDTNGSQFFIVQTSETYEAYLDQFGLTDEQKELFLKYGGTPWLYQAHTVFGQVYEGMDVVDAIAAVQTNSKDKPLEDVVIESITVTE